MLTNDCNLCEALLQGFLGDMTAGFFGPCHFFGGQNNAAQANQG